MIDHDSDAALRDAIRAHVRGSGGVGTTVKEIVSALVPPRPTKETLVRVMDGMFQAREIVMRAPVHVAGRPSGDGRAGGPEGREETTMSTKSEPEPKLDPSWLESDRQTRPEPDQQSRAHNAGALVADDIRSEMQGIAPLGPYPNDAREWRQLGRRLLKLGAVCPALAAECERVAVAYDRVYGERRHGAAERTEP